MKTTARTTRMFGSCRETVWLVASTAVSAIVVVTAVYVRPPHDVFATVKTAEVAR